MGVPPFRRVKGCRKSPVESWSLLNRPHLVIGGRIQNDRQTSGDILQRQYDGQNDGHNQADDAK